EDVEVVRSQQIVGDLVVNRHVHGTAFHDRAPCAQLLGERDRVCPYGGIDEQPPLRITLAGEDLRDPADHALHGKPLDALPHWTLLHGRHSVPLMLLACACRTELRFGNVVEAYRISIRYGKD